jgi:drug/metabolite transporter (DMT)-like permease
MLIVAAGAWAASLVYVRAHRLSAPPLQLAPWQTGIAAILLVPLAVLLEGRPSSIPLRAAATLLYVGPVATAFAYWAVVEVGRRLGPRTISMALLATPPLGILISAALFNERLDASVIGGALLIAGGILLAHTLRCNETNRCND